MITVHGLIWRASQNSDVKMDRGPVIFTSDVSLAKDDKSASEVKNYSWAIDRIMKAPQC